MRGLLQTDLHHGIVAREQVTVLLPHWECDGTEHGTRGIVPRVEGRIIEDCDRHIAVDGGAVLVSICVGKQDALVRLLLPCCQDFAELRVINDDEAFFRLSRRVPKQSVFFFFPAGLHQSP